MPGGAALVDAARQVAHLGHPVGDLVAEQHPAAAGLGALPDDHLDRVGGPEVVGIHPVAGREHLVDEEPRAAALLGRHPAVTGRRRGPDLGGGAAERLLRRRRERAKAHAGDRDRDLQLERPASEPRPEDDVGAAVLAVALEGVARDAGTEQQ
jgi:hypothetical protein